MLHGFSENGDRTRRLYSPAGLLGLAASRCGCPHAAAPADVAGLERLCAAFEAARPDQTAFGKFHTQSILLDALTKRFRLAEYERRFPEIRDADPPDPIFIVAPFRTATTFLHRLLSCDPDHRAPRMWEVAYPPPAEPDLRGDAGYLTGDARIARATAALRTLHRAAPALERLHPMAAGLAEECFGLLETSLLSHSFMFYADVSSYLDWLDTRDEEDWRAAYDIYAAQLRLLHWWYPGRRWVLKSPVHLWNLDVLLHTFPLATVIQLHRDPANATHSFRSLLTAYRQVMCKTADPVAIGAEVARYTCAALERAVTARRRFDASRFIDLEFADLISDPMTCVQAIYARIGAWLTPAAAAAMGRFMQHPKR